MGNNFVQYRITWLRQCPHFGSGAGNFGQGAENFGQGAGIGAGLRSCRLKLPRGLLAN